MIITMKTTPEPRTPHAERETRTAEPQTPIAQPQSQPQSHPHPQPESRPANQGWVHPSASELVERLSRRIEELEAELQQQKSPPSRTGHQQASKPEARSAH